jgi:hypothetical protein
MAPPLLTFLTQKRATISPLVHHGVILYSSWMFGVTMNERFHRGVIMGYSVHNDPLENPEEIQGGVVLSH